jgi:hypothetical protein
MLVLLGHGPQFDAQVGEQVAQDQIISARTATWSNRFRFALGNLATMRQGLRRRQTFNGLSAGFYPPPPK